MRISVSDKEEDMGEEDLVQDASCCEGSSVQSEEKSVSHKQLCKYKIFMFIYNVHSKLYSVAAFRKPK